MNRTTPHRTLLNPKPSFWGLREWEGHSSYVGGLVAACSLGFRGSLLRVVWFRLWRFGGSGFRASGLESLEFLGLSFGLWGSGIGVSERGFHELQAQVFKALGFRVGC